MIVLRPWAAILVLVLPELFPIPARVISASRLGPFGSFRHQVGQEHARPEPALTPGVEFVADGLDEDAIGLAHLGGEVLDLLEQGVYDLGVGVGVAGVAVSPRVNHASQIRSSASRAVATASYTRSHPKASTRP